MRTIAILTNYPADFTSFSGGVETVTDDLLAGFIDRRPDLKIHLVSLSRKIGRDRNVIRDGIEYHFLAVPASPLLRPHMPYNIMKCFLLLKKIKPDLVHCHDNVSLALAAALGGYRRLFTIHGVRRTEAKLWQGRDYLSHQADRIVEWIVHRSYRYFTGPSQYAAGLVSRKKRVFILQNPVSDQFFEDEAAAAPRGISEILFVGSLTYLKQPHVLIDAYQRLIGIFPQLKLTICGSADDPVYLNRLLEKVKMNGLAGVRIFHDVPRSEVRAMMSQASVLVLPSVQENNPMVIAEAMAAGLPVVASRVGGIPHLIEHGVTGLLFNAGNAVELADRLRELMENKEMALRIRTQARRKAIGSFRSGCIVDRTVAIYRTIMAGGS